MELKQEGRKQWSWMKLGMVLSILDWAVIQGGASFLERRHRELTTPAPQKGEFQFRAPDIIINHLEIISIMSLSHINVLYTTM